MSEDTKSMKQDADHQWSPGRY